MRQDMKIALMEKNSPKLLEQLDIGSVSVKVKTNHIKNFLFFKKESGKYIKVSSDVLYKLEKKCNELSDKGHEIIESVYVSNTKYCVHFSYKTNPNSIYLKMKRQDKKNKELQKKWGKK